MTIKQAAMWLCQPGIVSMIHDPTTKKALSVAVKALTESELSTNLAEVGTDCISRQAAIDALRGYLVEKRCPDDGTLTCRLIENEVINKLPSAQPEPIKIDLSGYSKEDWERVKKEWGNTPITVLSAQPKTGKWISADAIFGGVPFYCSECGENTRDTVMGKPRWNFCPNCGAKMEVNNESN